MPEETLLHPKAGNDAAVPATTASAATITPESVVATKGSEVDYSRYSVGDTLKGVTIAMIVFQDSSAIVFADAAGDISFYHSLGARGDAVGVQFHRIVSKTIAKLRHAYRRAVTDLLATAIAESLNGKTDEGIRSAFAPVDAFIDNITHVFGYTDEWVVYLDAQDNLVCDYPTVTEQAAPLLTEFYRLQQLAESALEADENKALKKILGTELAIALQRTPAPEPADAFSASRDYIQLRNESHMRAVYIFSSLAAAVIFGIAAYFIIHDDLGLLLGTVGGIIGAAISVLQRSATLEIRRFLPRGQVIMQGVVRITLGLLFGLLIVSASRANVALGSFASSVNSLFLAGVAAGFSERFVPDLLTKITTDGDSGSSTK